MLDGRGTIENCGGGFELTLVVSSILLKKCLSSRKTARKRRGAPPPPGRPSQESGRLTDVVIRPAVVEGDGDLELSVQDHLISQPLAVIGIRNQGKSFFVGKLCEELCEVKQPFVVIDPEGEYWSLREKYPVVIAAVGKPVGRPKGYKADLIVNAETAPVLARRIAEKGYSLVLDLRNATMAESYEALGGFLEALYGAEAEYNRPLVLIMEEAHVLVPEVGRVRLPSIKKAQDRVIYWTYEIAARGRHRGLGYVAVARRAAEVAKAVLSQAPNRVIFKLVDPTDLAWLRESGLSREEINVVKRLPQGKAIVIGLSEQHFFIRSKPRKCTHGGRTPIAKAVETPELEGAVADLSGLLKQPLQEIEEPTEEPAEKLKALTATYEERISELEKALKEEKRRRLELAAENETLKAEISSLKAKVLSADERAKYEARIRSLEREVSSLKEQLSKAAEIEKTLERIRENVESWKDLILETSSVLGLEIVPSDVQALIQERDELRKKLEVYEREEALKNELVQQTLRDPGVRSWIRDAERLLYDLRRRGQAGAVILKTALRMDPEVAFLPEEIQTGYTAQTNLNYLNMLQSRGLLWEARKRNRKAFRNRLRQWVAENVRRIRPSAPDEAIDKITEQLKNTILR